ncbi:MAG: FAD-dependent oxidoreductase [Paracoccus sp. (in: a-proteobacteria)]|uniref:FAD-dependent oxidoreductase n=1 Tax=Paracoccus sp. TaxID=267 RepID=UPI0026E06903|nr:FAD-dependent oxidoreductase [Paracoccus sp. (in: a-proteobacteria)]MDO5631541.1 FAD-dependent oxidoreductase [Paracoccus sp. (in: a-proteobacteria)]
MTGALRNRPVTIIGAGVAGLTAATALAQRGARVTVLEQADALREVGAGLQISPNAGRGLAALGLADAADAVSLRSHGVRMHSAAGRLLAQLDLPARQPDAPFRLFYRARLVEVLEQGARDAGAEIRLNTPITDLPDAPLLIGADGLRSMVRAALNGPARPYYTGQTAWRMLIPDDGSAPWADLFMGPGRHLVSYPLAGGLRNIVAVLARPHWKAEGWSYADSPANLRRAFAGFGGPVPDWLAQVQETGVWGLFRHDVAPFWHDDSRVIIGDAAHPTLPFMAQGAAMAIEDGWLLAACLDADPDQAAALARFQALRQDRCTRIVATASRNATAYHLQGPAALAARIGLRGIGALAPERLTAQFDWIYGYDPRAAV